jgi:hypothetical protein
MAQEVWSHLKKVRHFFETRKAKINAAGSLKQNPRAFWEFWWG